MLFPALFIFGDWTTQAYGQASTTVFTEKALLVSPGVAIIGSGLSYLSIGLVALVVTLSVLPWTEITASLTRYFHSTPYEVKLCYPDELLSGGYASTNKKINQFFETEMESQVNKVESLGATINGVLENKPKIVSDELEITDDQKVRNNDTLNEEYFCSMHHQILKLENQLDCFNKAAYGFIIRETASTTLHAFQEALMLNLIRPRDSLSTA